MATVCILVPTLVGGDGVGHDVEGMFSVMREKGIEVHILAQHWAPDVALPVEPFDRYEAYAGRPDIITVYHHAIAWEAGYRRFLQARGPKVLRYHNVTPPSFFVPYNEQVASECRTGRAQTAILARSGRIDLFLGDSRYNIRELETLGAPPSRCQVLPPFHKLPDPSNVQAPISLLEQYLDGKYNVLFLGRVVPNKGHRHLLGVLAAYRQLFDYPIRLFIVGDLAPPFHAYHQELHALAQGLRVADAVTFTGRVGMEELKAYFLLAHAFLAMSEHEGFCVPLVEAMAHNIPVVAHASTAVSETVGDAGIVLECLDYTLYAASLELLFTRADLRDCIIKRQHDRVSSHFSMPVLSQRFCQLIAPLLP